jgi:hypothetical protein
MAKIKKSIAGRTNAVREVNEMRAIKTHSFGVLQIAEDTSFPQRHPRFADHTEWFFAGIRYL